MYSSELWIVTERQVVQIADYMPPQRLGLVCTTHNFDTLCKDSEAQEGILD